MRRAGVVPSVITCSALMSARENGRQLAQSLELLQAMRQQGVVANITTYAVLISKCEKGKQPAPAMEIF